MVPLLPKLRGQFAEFLNHSSPDRLSILYLTTCVGLGVRAIYALTRGFSRQHRITKFPTTGMHHASPSYRTDLPILRATRLHHNPISGLATFLRHPIAWLLPVQVPRSHTQAPSEDGESVLLGG